MSACRPTQFQMPGKAQTLPAVAPGVALSFASGVVNDQQKATLTFDTPPPRGAQITIHIALYALDPAGAMFSDNSGGRYGAPDVIAALAGQGDPQDGIVATFSRIVTEAKPASPFRISIDTGAKAAAGNVPGRWWTWAISWHTAPAASPLDGTDTDVNSNAAGASTIPKVPGALSAASTTSRAIAFMLAMNRGHAERPINVPDGWSVIVNNSEDSKSQSGHVFYRLLDAPGAVSPVAAVTDIATKQASEITGYRAALVIYKLAATQTP